MYFFFIMQGLVANKVKLLAVYFFFVVVELNKPVGRVANMKLKQLNTSSFVFNDPIVLLNILVFSLVAL